MGQGIFLGEAYLPLQELEDDNMDRPLHDLAQLQIPLTRPQDHGKKKLETVRSVSMVNFQSPTSSMLSIRGSTTDKRKIF